MKMAFGSGMMIDIHPMAYCTNVFRSMKLKFMAFFQHQPKLNDLTNLNLLRYDISSLLWAYEFVFYVLYTHQYELQIYEDTVDCLPPNKRARVEVQEICVTSSKPSNKRGKKKQGKKVSQLSLITPPDLSTFAICWVKLRGFNEWPGVIESCVNGKYNIHFFGDYTRSTVNKKAITNFYEGFSLFSHTFEKLKLSKAIKEACICLMRQPNPTVCLVCEIGLNPKQF